MAIRDTSVVWGHSDMQNAPVLTGVAGSLVSLLKACLVDGWGATAVNSIVVTNGVATMTIAAGMPFTPLSVIEIRDSALPDLNRKWRLDSVDAFSAAFTVDDAVPPGNYSGAITARMASAGWELSFEDAATHRAVFRSASLYGTGMYLYVVDSDARYANVRGYESVTDIDVRELPFPTEAQAAAAAFVWAKSNTAGAAQVRGWALAADTRLIVPCLAWHSTYAPGAEVNLFGDAVEFASADTHCCLLSANPNATPSSPAQGNANIAINIAGPSMYAARALDLAPGAIRCRRAALAAGAGAVTAASVWGGLSYVPLYACTTDAANSPIRGLIPGLLLGMEQLSGLANYTVEDTEPPLLRVRAGGQSVGTNIHIGLPIVGPWR